MIDKSTIQTYINNFRRRFAPFLKPGIGLACYVHPVVAGGAILEFRIASQIENQDIYNADSATLGRALSQIPQHAFGGNLDGFTFGGTNVILEPGKIIFIKEGSIKEWSDAAAEKDVRQIIISRKSEGAQ
jgi:hypothetical protein